MREHLLCVGLVAAVLIAAGLIGKAVYDYERFRTLQDDGRFAKATVNAIELAVHNRRGPTGRWLIRYSFRTPSNELVNADVGVTRELAATFHVGQVIDVVYAPANPSMTALNPEQAWAVVLYDERVLVPYMAVFMVLVWNAIERYRGRTT